MSTKRMSLRPNIKKRSPEETESGASAASEDTPESKTPQDTEPESQRDGSPILHSAPKHPGASRAAIARSGLGQLSSQRNQQQSTALSRELEDLKTRLRVMEKKRAEDREKLKNLERLQAERDKFETIIQKLQTKYQPQQFEITELRKKLKESEIRLEELERLQAEHDSILEMVALDREMAEETAEALKVECQTLKSRLEELVLEVEVMREENEELSQVMSPEEKSSQGWLQMEKTNERLREALIRLRDMTQQQETELRNQIKELEDDLEEYSSVKAQYETTKERLLVSEANMEDLKQQLETALGAEEMIEELADKNMQYQEEINELKAAIEDLESLKEINDELELNHVETEKQLQEEIDYRENIFNEQSRKVAQQEAAIDDLEYTLSRFRELITNLQNDLEDMRASQQITETEANELTMRSRAMMDLNLKLQASVEKAQTKTIDIELGRMEAGESLQHLSIVRLYLPEHFDGERNSILSFLQVKRVGFKASLINSTIRERMGDQTALPASQENIFTAYDVLEKLLWISCICERFVSFVTGCSPDQFSKFERALYELEPVERTLNSWIDGLKKNEFNEKKCATELQRSIALLSHLAETLIPVETETYADETYMRSLLIQTYLDHTAASLSRLKVLLQGRIPILVENDEDGLFLFSKLETHITQARGLKVVIGKVTRSLDELRSRSLALSDDAAGPFGRTEEVAGELAGLTRQLGENVLLLISEEGRTEPFTYAEILRNMSETAMSRGQPSAVNEGNDSLSSLGARLRTLAVYLEELSTHASDLAHTTEFERHSPPWIARAEERKSNRSLLPDADEEIRRLRNELTEAFTALGVKDQTLEEQSLKVELLESRMRDASKKTSVVKQLEARFEEMQNKETELLGAVEKLTGEVQTVETERDELKSRLERAKRASGTTGASISGEGVIMDSGISLATLHENETLRAEVASLQAAVRFLRDDNLRANFLDPYSVQRSTNMYSWLDSPLTQANPSKLDEGSLYKAAESRDVFTHLLKLTKESRIVDMQSTLPPDSTNHFSWRPMKSTFKFQVLQQRENFERWAEWKDDVASRVKERKRVLAAKKQRILCERERKQKQSDPTAPSPKKDATPTLSYGMMGRAWEILGIDRSSMGEFGGVGITSPS